MKIQNDPNQKSMTWRTSISFVMLATLIVVLIGYLISMGLLPIRETIDFEGGELQLIRVWMKVAIALGLVLPTVALTIGLKYPQQRKVFGFYLLLLLIQIVTEQVFSQAWMPSLVVPIGTLYSMFRVWQIKQGLQLVQSVQKQRLKYKLLNGVLWLVFCFWAGNLVILITLAWPRIYLHNISNPVRQFLLWF